MPRFTAHPSHSALFSLLHPSPLPTHFLFFFPLFICLLTYVGFCLFVCFVLFFETGSFCVIQALNSHHPFYLNLPGVGLQVYATTPRLTHSLFVLCCVCVCVCVCVC
ncbi:mCG1050973 [Mus musculus]|nr:mCG1050973 [Mus musculus]